MAGFEGFLLMEMNSNFVFQLGVFFFADDLYMDVSENSGTPKWMVYNGIL